MLDQNVLPNTLIAEQSRSTQKVYAASDDIKTSKGRQPQFLAALKGKKVRIRFAGGEDSDN
jgi:hypothetical protein